MFVNQVACTEIILEAGARWFFNLLCIFYSAEIQKDEPGYEEM